MRHASVVQFAKSFAVLTCALFGVPRVARAQAPARLAGYWQRPNGGAVFAIAPCADSLAGHTPGASLCGRLVWTKDGVAGQDAKNPDPTLRTQPLCNTLVVGGLTPNGPSAWKDGWIYNWKSGKRYGASFAVTGDSTAELRARWGFLHKTDKWRRVVAPPATCHA